MRGFPPLLQLGGRPALAGRGGERVDDPVPVRMRDPQLRLVVRLDLRLALLLRRAF
jgi:hypothetical protein